VSFEIYLIIDTSDANPNEGVMGFEASVIDPNVVPSDPVMLFQSVTFHSSGFNFYSPPWSNYRVALQDGCESAQPFVAATITLLSLYHSLTNLAYTLGPANPSAPGAFGGPAWISCETSEPVPVPHCSPTSPQAPGWTEGNVVFYCAESGCTGAGLCPPGCAVETVEKSWGTMKSQFGY